MSRKGREETEGTLSFRRDKHQRAEATELGPVFRWKAACSCLWSLAWAPRLGQARPGSIQLCLLQSPVRKRAPQRPLR